MGAAFTGQPLAPGTEAEGPSAPTSWPWLRALLCTRARIQPPLVPADSLAGRGGPLEAAGGWRGRWHGPPCFLTWCPLFLCSELRPLSDPESHRERQLRQGKRSPPRPRHGAVLGAFPSARQGLSVRVWGRLGLQSSLGLDLEVWERSRELRRRWHSRWALRGQGPGTLSSLGLEGASWVARCLRPVCPLPGFSLQI